MTTRLSFNSLNAKSPREIRRDLHNLWEGCVPFEEAILMVGVQEDDWQRREEYERFWSSLG